MVVAGGRGGWHGSNESLIWGWCRAAFPRAPYAAAIAAAIVMLTPLCFSRPPLAPSSFPQPRTPELAPWRSRSHTQFPGSVRRLDLQCGSWMLLDARPQSLSPLRDLCLHTHAQ